MSAALAWTVLFCPLLAAAVILLFTRSAPQLSALVSVAAAAVAFGASGLIFVLPPPAGPVQLDWINLHLEPLGQLAGGAQAGRGLGLFIPFGLTVDHLSKLMLLIVTGVGLLVHVYSLGYMQDDDGKARYFAGLSLFMFSMLGIVLANNFVMMFVFWELVGVSSYLLIGHWFDRPAAADAANKAFLVNRIGDFGFMLGILMFWGLTQTLEFGRLQQELPRFAANPAYATYLTIATLLVFCGPLGKSAQFPLHVWLPDAMEGPTPVSALIHAATMVAAGVYLLARVGFLLAVSPVAQAVIAGVGIVTAVLAALMATQQDDIKRILAFSTLSQLGYMVTAVGLADPNAAMFHLFTHASFKALLFLGAGAVIHALHHEQDIWKMGGLRGRLPITFVTFVVGSLALMGCPLLSGFFSKDEILALAAGKSPWIYGLAVFTAFLTAFYMTRLIVVAFLNPPSSPEIAHAHEVPAVMWVPLVILAVPAVAAGYLPVGKYLGLGSGEGVDPGADANALTALSLHPAGGLLSVPVLSVAAFVLGVALAFPLYFRRQREPVRISLFEHKFYVDEFYSWLVRSTQDTLARTSAWVDRWVIDGAGVRGLSGATFGAGFVLRFLQIGNLQAYAFLFGVGVLVLLYLALRS